MIVRSRGAMELQKKKKCFQKIFLWVFFRFTYRIDFEARCNYFYLELTQKNKSSQCTINFIIGMVVLSSMYNEGPFYYEIYSVSRRRKFLRILSASRNLLMRVERKKNQSRCRKTLITNSMWMTHIVIAFACICLGVECRCGRYKYSENIFRVWRSRRSNYLETKRVRWTQSTVTLKNV